MPVLASFLSSLGDFFGDLASVDPVSLLIGLACFGIYLAFRSRAWFHVLRAAYPDARIQWRRCWGAYMAAYGFNNVVPARGGDVMKVFLTRQSVPGSSYPAITSSMAVELLFDLTIAIPVLVFSFSQGVFPKLPDFSALGGPLGWFASHMQATLFILTVLGILVFVGFATLSARVRAFWARVRQGVVIVRDRPRYLREVFLFQLIGWGFRFAAFWMLLDAFGVGGSVQNVLLVLGVNIIAALLPFAPGGAGIQQALLVKVFGSSSVVAAYSVGQQVMIGAFSLAVGFLALVTIFKFRSFKAVIAEGRAARAADEALKQPAS